MKKYFAEAMGTFLLTFVVITSLHGSFPVATPILAGLTLGLMVYVIGSISGAHINPAVTIGVWSLSAIGGSASGGKKMSAMTALGYIVSQFVGAGLAMYLGRYLGASTALPVANTMVVGFSEFIGTLFFTFGIAAVVLGKVPLDASGLTIGGSLLLGLSLASAGSNAVLNPAVAFGLGSFSWVYALAPVLGSLVGMQLFKWLAKSPV